MFPKVLRLYDLFVYLKLFFNRRKEEKRMLKEYNNKLQTLIQEKCSIIRHLKKENKAIKEVKMVITRFVYK